MRRRVNTEHQFGTPLHKGWKFTKFTVGTNHGRWWVQAKEEGPGRGGSSRYMLWNREGETDFTTELEAIALVLEWVVHHTHHRAKREACTGARAVH